MGVFEMIFIVVRALHATPILLSYLPLNLYLCH